MTKTKENGGALALTTCEGYLDAQKTADLAEAWKANLGTGETFDVNDLVRIKTPAGGGTMWEYEDAMGNLQHAKEIEGVLVYFARRGTLWPSLDQTGSPPVLVTENLIAARQVSTELGDIDQAVLDKYRNDDGTIDWVNLPYNQWGTGKNGAGKRCKESRVMFILRKGDVFPVVVQAQPGSLKTVVPWIKKLTISQAIPYYAAVVSLELQPAVSKVGNHKYSQIIPKLTGVLDRESREKIRVNYTAMLERLMAHYIDRQEEFADETAEV